jgi:hypothetical protein
VVELLRRESHPRPGLTQISASGRANGYRRRMHGVNVIERAYQLAPECGTVDEVRHKLSREGYFQVEAHLRGPQIRGELVRRLKRD